MLFIWANAEAPGFPLYLFCEKDAASIPFAGACSTWDAWIGMLQQEEKC